MTNPTERPEEQGLTMFDADAYKPEERDFHGPNGPIRHTDDDPETANRYSRVYEEQIAALEAEAKELRANHRNVQNSLFASNGRIMELEAEVKELREENARLREDGIAGRDTADAAEAKLKQMEMENQRFSEALRGIFAEPGVIFHGKAAQYAADRARAALDGPSDDAESVYEDPMLAAHAKLLKEDK